MKAIVVGRHAGEVPGVEVVETRAVTFPVTAEECAPVIGTLVAEALALGAVVLFQNLPAQVGAALVHMALAYGTHQDGPRTGVIVSLPGERPGRVERRVVTDDIEAVRTAVTFANPRATIKEFVTDMGYDEETVAVVEVDGPPMPFVFSHVEWLV